MSNATTYKVLLDTEIDNEHVGQVEFELTTHLPFSSEQAEKIGAVLCPGKTCYAVKIN